MCIELEWEYGIDISIGTAFGASLVDIEITAKRWQIRVKLCFERYLGSYWWVIDWHNFSFANSPTWCTHYYKCIQNGFELCLHTMNFVQHIGCLRLAICGNCWWGKCTDVRTVSNRSFASKFLGWDIEYTSINCLSHLDFEKLVTISISEEMNSQWMTYISRLYYDFICASGNGSANKWNKSIKIGIIA